jgi:hypothetical protein
MEPIPAGEAFREWRIRFLSGIDTAGHYVIYLNRLVQCMTAFLPTLPFPSDGPGPKELLNLIRDAIEPILKLSTLTDSDHLSATVNFLLLCVRFARQSLDDFPHWHSVILLIFDT